MQNLHCGANMARLSKAAAIAIVVLGSPPVAFGQGTGHAVVREEQSKAFIIASGGSFYSIAADGWFTVGGIGIGREFGQRFSLEVDVARSGLETPANRLGRGSSEMSFKTPITTGSVAARAGLPFAPALFFGAGAGVLYFDGSKDRVGNFGASTLMGIVGGGRRITNRVFGRLEGHYLVVRHPPFNGVNVEIVGAVGLRL